MKNLDLFTLDPVRVNLKNEGVAKLRAINDQEDVAIAEYELRTFVCEGEYHEGLRKILEFYLRNFDEQEQPAFWVSGFYGSGKSHLVKMASYLWGDYVFPGGQTARTLKPLPQDIQDLLVEIDRKQGIYGKLSVSGTLRDFPSSNIHYSFLQVFLNCLGLPQQFHHFKFYYWLKREGIYDGVEAVLHASGRKLKSETEKIFVSSSLARAVLQMKPEMATNEANMLELFRQQFARKDEISRDDFVNTIKNEILPLFYGEKIPCTLIVLDEVQQFIGQDPDLSFQVQLLAEDLCSRFSGRFLLVGTGQNALTDTPVLQRLMARFKVPVQLTNTDIQTVIRKTILEKKASAVTPIKNKLEQMSGEIARNLEGSTFGYLTEDKNTLVADYPVLPSTRKFWYKVLQTVDVAGTSGQLRNQLRLIDDSLKFVAHRDLGQIIPADYIFTQIRSELILSGLLSNDASNLIQGKKALGGDAELEGRILSAVFLLDRITSASSSSGLKANENTIADLLIDDLNVGSDVLRNKVNELVGQLVNENNLMAVGDEFKLQTKMGAEWEQEFSSQFIRLNSTGDDQIQSHRREKILNYVKEKTRGIHVTQGVSRIPREFDLWDKEAPPNMEHKLNIWIRDGWNERESTVIDEIRAAGIQTPLCYVFVSKQRDIDLRKEIIRFLAAGFTINVRGLPTTPEAEQARRSMETRMAQAKMAISELIERICSESTVYLAGGTKVQSGTWKENIQEALKSIADRQFSLFQGKADHANWGQALQRATQGVTNALSAVDYQEDADRHPVAQEILRYLSQGPKNGKDIRSNFMKAPYGWSQDAIDAILILLKNIQYVSTSEVSLSASKVGQAIFKKEVHTLTAQDKIKIRKLFQDGGVACPSGQDIFPYSNQYLDNLKSLAAQSGGQTPRPDPVRIEHIKQIENRDGNERLLEILEQRDLLQSNYEEWTSKSKSIAEREPQWFILLELLEQAPDAAEFDAIRLDVNAIQEHRLLLENPDKVRPLLELITEQLLNMLNQRKERYKEIRDERMADLQGNDYFKKLTPEEKHSILLRHQLLGKVESMVLEARMLLDALHQTSLNAWDTKIAALKGQFESALEDAVRLSAPQAASFQFPRRTITSQAELDVYIAEITTELSDLLQTSGSIILH